MPKRLHFYIFLSILLAIPAGLFLQDYNFLFSFVGEFFIRLLRLTIVPLIFASLVVAVISVGNIRRLGKIGGQTAVYFLTTTLVASFLGLLIGNIFHPGLNTNIHPPVALEETASQAIALPTMLKNIVPTNIFQAVASENLLGLIFFALFLGCVLTVVGDRGRIIGKLMEGLNEVFLKMTSWIMYLAPIGIFALIAELISKTGIEMLRPLFFYMLLVFAGLSMQFVLLMTMLKIQSRYKIYRFIKQMFPALVTAFSTDSSLATLPVTMRCLEKNAGVSKKITGFVAALGATMNMNGTALFLSIATLFIAQIYGLHLTMVEQVVIGITAALAAISAAGVPGGSWFTIAIIFKAINLPLEGLALILAVDRILDMCRTVVNVFGNMCIAVILAEKEGEDLNY